MPTNIHYSMLRIKYSYVLLNLQYVIKKNTLYIITRHKLIRRKKQKTENPAKCNKIIIKTRGLALRGVQTHTDLNI